MQKGKEAFSLMELLVVIGCIAVLASLLWPSFNAARDKGKTAKSISNLKQMAAAMHMYIMDNNNTLPRADGTASDPGLDWAQGLRPYGGSHRLPEPSMEQNPILINPAGASPEWPVAGPKSSYCMNGNLQVNTPPAAGQSVAPVYPISLAKVVRPTQTVLFADCLYAGRAMNYSHLAYRNNNKTRATMVFVDGHAEALTKTTVSYEANFANPPLQ
jgi:prepilin-type processing-associated H-X9-DG protein